MSIEYLRGGAEPNSLYDDSLAMDNASLRRRLSEMVSNRRIEMAVIAACRNDTTGFKRLVRAGFDINETGTMRGQVGQVGQVGHSCSGVTALHFCCEDGADWPRLITFLVERGATVDAKTSDGTTPLLRAAAWGRVEMVKELLRCGANVNAADRDGNTPLIAVVGSGPDDGLIQTLIDAGAEIDPQGKNKFSALSSVMSGLVKRGDFSRFEILKLLIRGGANPSRALIYLMAQLIRGSVLSTNQVNQIFDYLVGAGADVNFIDTEGEEGRGIKIYTPLGNACICGDVDMVRRLLSHGADVNLADSRGSTPLIYAAATSCSDVLSLLISRGAILDATDNLGYTALMYAFGKNSIDDIRILLDAGANADIPESGCAVAWARQLGRKKIYHLLTHTYGYKDWYLVGAEIWRQIWERERKATEAAELALTAAAEQERREADDLRSRVFTAYGESWVKALPLLDENHHDTNLLNELLLRASQTGNIHAVRAMLQRGANVDTRDDKQNTPLLRSLKRNNGLASFLISAGADVNCRGELEYAPLHWAAIRSDVSTVSALLSAGADVNSVTPDGKTAFMFALVADKPDVAKMLLSAGADPTFSDDKGRNALMIAAACADEAFVESLLRYNNVNARDFEGKTALMYAAHEGSVPIAETLYLGGANVALRDRQKRNAATIARDAGNDEMFRFLSEVA